MLVRLLYASRAAAPLTPSVVDSILAQSRAHNPGLGITGMLCYSEDLFLQVLEGGRDEVCELYNTIVRDDRHVNVRILCFEEISERRFGSWTMGHVNVATVNPSLLLKYAKLGNRVTFFGVGDRIKLMAPESAELRTSLPDASDALAQDFFASLEVYAEGDA